MGGVTMIRLFETSMKHERTFSTFLKLSRHFAQRHFCRNSWNLCHVSANGDKCSVAVLGDA